MKRYEYPQRGLTLFEVSVALSVAIAAMLGFTSFYLNIMERTAIEQTVYRAKLVYEGALAYRIKEKQWPGEIAVLTRDSYIPVIATQTSWGHDIFTGVQGSNLLIWITTPSKPIADSIAARLPAAAADNNGGSVTVPVIPPGQEFSLALFQDLAGERPWTGHHEAGGNDLTDVHTLKAKFIATNEEVTVGDSCSAETDATEEEKKNNPGKGARAMAEVTDGVFAPVFCDGTTWVREDKSALSDCKICLACGRRLFDQSGSRGRHFWYTYWDPLVCNNASADDRWTQTESTCEEGYIALRFVCGEDNSNILEELEEATNWSYEE